MLYYCIFTGLRSNTEYRKIRYQKYGTKKKNMFLCLEADFKQFNAYTTRDETSCQRLSYIFDYDMAYGPP